MRKRRSSPRWRLTQTITSPFYWPLARTTLKAGALYPKEHSPPDLGRKVAQLVMVRKRKGFAVRKDREYRDGYGRFLVRLRQARKDAGMSQKTLAERLGRHQTYVSKAESGELRLDFVQVEMLARIYGKDITFFCTS